nr:URC4/urg3 family protein [Romeria gracilis]
MGLTNPFAEPEIETDPDSPAVAEVIRYLQSPQAIRERCGDLFELACQDRLPHFRCVPSQLGRVADYVIEVTRSRYPQLDIPFHSRWRHFEVEGQSLLARFEPAWNQLSALERARAEADLAMTSVLLDAGAGAAWQYQDAESGQVYSRSEGLAIASLNAFRQGLFSSQPEQPWQADSAGLRQLTLDQLADSFQVSEQNPLVGLEGRWQLLQKLGAVIQAQPQRFGSPPRPGHLIDSLQTQAVAGQIAAAQVLQAVLEGLGDIWPGRSEIAGFNLGDVWPHPALPQTGLGSQLVPFHKLSQWLTYSLLEPLQELGLAVTQLDALTGLAEYRNGGLFIDLGLFHPKQSAILTQAHAPGSPPIVEWRALTVIALDRVATEIRQRLNLSDTTLPLPKILQGGTWAAGRQTAAVRPGGKPPIEIASDGTVF